MGKRMIKENNRKQRPLVAQMVSSTIPRLQGFLFSGEGGL